MAEHASTRRNISRRAIMGSAALAVVGMPLAISRYASAVTVPSAVSQGTQSRWAPKPASVGVHAFEGIEADRAGKFPGRKYVVVEDSDHYRFNIWADDRDSTGGGDRQRTEVKGMVQDGTIQKMLNGEKWVISYEMFMPSTLHGTSKFTHIFQTKTPSTNGGPWVTLDLSRSGSKETMRARAYSTSGAPDIASTDLAPLRNKWISVESVSYTHLTLPTNREV